MSLFTMAELEAAADLVHAAMAPTPQYAWPLLAERTGAEVWVKHENHTPTGAFKLRGGLVYMDWLSKAHPQVREVVTATRGNHGQSVPFASARHGIKARIYVPHGNSKEKNAAMRAWGAELVVHGGDFDEARIEAERVCQQEGAWFLPSFDRLLACGVATYALELFQAVPDLATVYVPIGLGSGICGLITARDLLGLETEVVGVISENAPCYALSVAAGRPVSTDSADTIADGVAVRVPHPDALDIIAEAAARIVQVSDAEIIDAMRAYYTDTHNLAEGAGAVPLAGMLQERERQKGKRVACILCGGNIDLHWFLRLMGRTSDLGNS